MSFPRRLGRVARGFVLGIQDDERFQETIRAGRERGETLKETFGDALGAAWRGAAEEWRTAEEDRDEEEPSRSRPGGRSGEWRERASGFIPRKYSMEVLGAYNRLGLDPGAPADEVHRKRRDLIKRVHPDRFSDPDKRSRAERISAEINAAHDTIVRHMPKG